MQAKTNENELFWLISLNLIDGIGVKNARNLISYTGSVEAIFKEKKKSLIKIPGIGEYTATKILNADVSKRAEKRVEKIR